MRITQKLIREELGKKFPNMPQETLEALIKKTLSDPQFMDMAKQMAKEKQTEPGRPPKWTQEDLAKLAKAMPGGGGPKKFPIDPKLPFDTKLPFDSKQPFDPKKETGDPGRMGTDSPSKANLKNPVEQPAGRNPMEPPGGTNPMNPGAWPPPPPRNVEDELFRPPPEPTDPRAKSLQAFAAVWERNVGPLDQTPEVKRALFDLAGSANGLDLDLKDDKGNSVWDLLRKGEGEGLSFGNFMEGGGSWHMPQMNLPQMNFGKWWRGSSGNSSSSSSSSSSWGSGSSSRSRSGSSGGSGGFGSFSFGGSWFPVIVLGVVVLGILLWVLVKRLREGTPELVLDGAGLGPWPIDPRTINTREDVVKAFEYLSVLICGPSAKTWTHNTIADALSELATTHGETAVMLARLYELARYAPLDEPLTRDELMEARELVCGLAGVSY